MHAFTRRTTASDLPCGRRVRGQASRHAEQRAFGEAERAGRRAYGGRASDEVPTKGWCRVHLKARVCRSCEVASALPSLVQASVVLTLLEQHGDPMRCALPRALTARGTSLYRDCRRPPLTARARIVPVRMALWAKGATTKDAKPLSPLPPQGRARRCAVPSLFPQSTED